MDTQEQLAATASVIINDEDKKRVDPNNLPPLYEGMVIGSTGTSVGTHLALESIFFKNIDNKFDPDREIPNYNIDNYKTHVWNIYTIVRNVLGAIPHKEKIDILRDPFFPKLLASEVNNIATMYMFDTDCRPVLFFPDYSRIYRGMNMNKKDGYTKVFEEHMLVKEALTALKNSGKLKSINNGKGFKLPVFEGRTLITTNLSVDLLNKGNIDLLESHTGVLKKKYEFNTKYHTIGENKLENIPFMETLLYILGDKTIIKPMNIIIRRELVKVASEGQWTNRTSREKVFADINRKGQPFLRDTYNGYRTFY